MVKEIKITNWRFYIPMLIVLVMFLFVILGNVPQSSLYDNAFIKCIGNCS